MYAIRRDILSMSISLLRNPVGYWLIIYSSVSDPVRFRPDPDPRLKKTGSGSQIHSPDLSNVHSLISFEYAIDICRYAENDSTEKHF